jgi:hypothetical protein
MRVAVLQRLVEVHAGVDEHDGHARIDFGDQAEHRGAFRAEGRNIGDLATELAHGGGDDILSGFSAQLSIKARDLLVGRFRSRCDRRHSAAFSSRFFWRFMKMVSVVSDAAW